MWWHSLGEADLPVVREWLSAAETDRMRKMRFTKRRNEWLLARWTAKQALAGVLGLPADHASLACIEIRGVVGGAAAGAPEVYVDGRRMDCAISLTDRAGWAVCAVGETGEIGCDLEIVESRSDTFIQDYFTARERKVVAHPPFEASPDLLANLIWSAKESALKVLRTGLRRDTRSVEIVLSPDVPMGGWRPFAARAEEGVRFSGWWRQYGAFLLTTATSREMAPPHPLREPPGLASAVPVHSWMATPIAADDLELPP